MLPGNFGTSTSAAPTPGGPSDFLQFTRGSGGARINSYKDLRAAAWPDGRTSCIRKCERWCEQQSSRLDPGPISIRVTGTCGINSAVECQLPKLKVASSNLVSRSKSLGYLGTLYPPARTTHRFPTNRIRAGDAVLREQLGDRRLRFTDAQRRRLAAKGRALGRRVLNQLGGS